MIDQVAAAFDRRDYKTAAQLLKQLLKQSPENPWVQLYVGRLQEVSGKPEVAQRIYRQLLRETTNPRIAIQARQGLQRLEATEQERRQQAIAEATADSANTNLGFLILEPIHGEARQSAARSLARIMKLDSYTAQLQLPGRGWRLYRTGSMAELQVYGQELRQAGIPVFWISLTELKKIRVFQVHYFQSTSPQAAVVCQNESDQLGSLSFDWSEVSKRVEGLLPIFEDVVDLDVRNKLKRKSQTQDYAQICDLHLPERNCILRLCDSTYQFQQSVVFDPHLDDKTRATQTTARISWNNLLNFLNSRLSEVPVYSGFTTFAETALDHLDLISDLKSHINLFRKAETKWDPAFQLYSGLVFLKTNED